VDASDVLSAAAQLGLERGQRRRLGGPAEHAEQEFVDEIDRRLDGGRLAADAKRVFFRRCKRRSSCRSPSQIAAS
jgi:hypothetical protein